VDGCAQSGEFAVPHVDPVVPTAQAGISVAHDAIPVPQTG